MGADYSFEVENIEIWAPAFFKHNNSSVATVPELIIISALIITPKIFFFSNKKRCTCGAVSRPLVKALDWLLGKI